MEAVIPSISQELLAARVGRSFPHQLLMNKLRKLGLIEYNGHLKVHSTLLNSSSSTTSDGLGRPSIRGHLCVAIGKLWFVCGWSVANAHRAKPPDVCLTICAIAISHQIVRRSLPAARLRHLPSNPFSRRVRRDPQPTNSSSMVPQDQEAIEQPEGERRHDEQVHRRHAVSMIGKKVLQPCDGAAPPPDDVLRNARLAHVDASLSSSPWSAGRAPERVRKAHVPDQLTEMKRDARSSAAPPGFPTPERSNPVANEPRPQAGRWPTRLQCAGARRYSPTNTNRSRSKNNLFGALRRSTLICCRTTSISASSRALRRRNKLATSAIHSSMIKIRHRARASPYSPACQPDRVFDGTADDVKMSLRA